MIYFVGKYQLKPATSRSEQRKKENKKILILINIEFIKKK